MFSVTGLSQTFESIRQRFNAWSFGNSSSSSSSSSNLPPTTTKVNELIKNPTTELGHYLYTCCPLLHEMCDLTSQYLEGHVDDEFNHLLKECEYDITKLTQNEHTSLLALAREVQHVTISATISPHSMETIFKIAAPSSLCIDVSPHTIANVAVQPLIDARSKEDGNQSTESWDQSIERYANNQLQMILQNAPQSLTTLDIVCDPSYVMQEISFIFMLLKKFIPHIEVINVRKCYYKIEQKLSPDDFYVAKELCFSGLDHLRELNGLAISFVEGFKDFAICPKLQKLQFRVKKDELITMHLTGFDDFAIKCFPALTELSVDVHWNDHLREYLWPLKSLVKTPKLTTLTLSDNAEFGDHLSQFMLSKHFPILLKFLAGDSESRDGLVKVNPALKIIRLGVLKDSAEVREKVTELREALAAQNVTLEIL